MAQLSPSIEFAWHVAAIEAIASKFDLIEPAHLLIGACSIDKVAASQMAHSPDFPSHVIEEWQQLEAALKACGKDPVSLRRRIRFLVGEGPCAELAQQKVSRSRESRTAFDLAQHAPGKLATLPVFVDALLEAAPVLRRWLSQEGVDIDQLRTQLKGEQAGSSATTFTFGRDLVQLAREQKLHACIGRDQELLDLVRTLSRVTKNNPMVLGDAGVGKTALVEGLAILIAHGEVLPNCRLVQLQTSELVAGTKYRGDFEERLNQLLSVARQDPTLILFIDEFHTVIGAGDARGGRDLSNILKPALARGEIRCIGATTTGEYRRYVESDPALERRFQPITLSEPTIEQTIEILKRGIVSTLHERHAVTIEPEAIEAAARLSSRFIPDRHLPDKAIDLLDEACARIAVPALGGDSTGHKDRCVTAFTVSEVTAQWARLPLPLVSAGTREGVGQIASTLKERIIAQDEACDMVARTFQRATAGLRPEHRPLAVLLFSGPTGVGKTELAKASAGALFGASKNMIRFDMSEFREAHFVSRLVGSPPGYIGHDREGELIRQLRSHPFSIVLLDEIDKAHPDVLSLFLQVFDDGRLTAPSGRTIDASNAIFILTTNVGAVTSRPIGFNADASDAVRIDSPTGLSAELSNRVDAVARFHPLNREACVQIARLLLRDLTLRVASQGVSMDTEECLPEWIVDKSFNPALGARPVRRYIEQVIESKIAEALTSAARPKSIKICVGCESISIQIGDTICEPVIDTGTN
jgi:ATP-dependent Clp protease ATP-binding subunit ClpC